MTPDQNGTVWAAPFGSPMASAVTIGEIGPLLSAFFPSVQSRECIWCSRADRSLNAAYPKNPAQRGWFVDPVHLLPDDDREFDLPAVGDSDEPHLGMWESDGDGWDEHVTDGEYRSANQQ